jgi:hypothetical protein
VCDNDRAEQSHADLNGILLAVATAVETALPAWSIRMISELDAADRRAHNLAKRLGPEQLNWKPRREVWSIGQCSHHLFVFNELYLPAISNSLDGQPCSRVEDVAPGWFGRWFIRNYVEPSSKSRRARFGWLSQYAGSLILTIAGSIMSALAGYAIKELPARLRPTSDFTPKTGPSSSVEGI